MQGSKVGGTDQHKLLYGFIKAIMGSSPRNYSDAMDAMPRKRTCEFISKVRGAFLVTHSQLLQNAMAAMAISNISSRNSGECTLLEDKLSGSVASKRQRDRK